MTEFFVVFVFGFIAGGAIVAGALALYASDKIFR